MKKLFPLLAALLLAGCATIEYSDEGGHTMVNVKNSGWYLLNIIPIASGNPDRPNSIDFSFFHQTTTLENNVRMLDYAATERNAVDIADVSTFTSDESVFVILFKHHVIHTSAELILTHEDNFP